MCLDPECSFRCLTFDKAFDENRRVIYLLVLVGLGFGQGTLWDVEEQVFSAT